MGVAVGLFVRHVRQERKQRRAIHNALKGKGVDLNPMNDADARLEAAVGTATTAVVNAKLFETRRATLVQARQMGAGIVHEGPSTTDVYGHEDMNTAGEEQGKLNERAVC